MKDRLELRRFCRIPPLIPYNVITSMGMIFIQGQFSAKRFFHRRAIYRMSSYIKFLRDQIWS